MISTCPARFVAASCQQHPNPRYQDGFCWHCHRKLPSPTRRNLVTEREIVEAACRGVLDPERVLTHARTRCEEFSAEHVSDPLDIRPGLNLDAEGREEAADGINYALFRMQAHFNSPGDSHRMNAIRYFAMAWDQLREAEDAER